MKYENTLHIVTPTKSHVNARFVESINGVLFSDICNHIKMNVTFEYHIGSSNIVRARSLVLTRWYDRSKDDDLFLFLDSDHVFSKDDIIKLVELKDCDVSCGIYPNSQGEPNAIAEDLGAFLDNYRDNRILYAGTGYMLIRRPICTKIKNYFEQTYGYSRVCIDYKTRHVIPFFKTVFIDSENGLEPLDEKHWLSEDTSFCWLVRHCGGVIRGFISQTLGHEVLNVRNFYPDNFVNY
jgi:hypothetical protein